jgi:hypothetical protein
MQELIDTTEFRWRYVEGPIRAISMWRFSQKRVIVRQRRQ